MARSAAAGAGSVSDGRWGLRPAATLDLAKAHAQERRHNQANAVHAGMCYRPTAAKNELAVPEAVEGRTWMPGERQPRPNVVPVNVIHDVRVTGHVAHGREGDVRVKDLAIQRCRLARLKESGQVH